MAQQPAVRRFKFSRVVWLGGRFGRCGGERLLGLPGTGIAQRPAVRRFKFPGVCGWEGVLGVVVVSGCSVFRRPGSPNGPPSPRLAPGGFYASTHAQGIRVREGWARANRAGVGKPSAARKAKLGFPRASEGQGCPQRASGEMARAHPELARGEANRAKGRMPVASVRRDGRSPPRACARVSYRRPWRRRRRRSRRRFGRRRGRPLRSCPRR